MSFVVKKCKSSIIVIYAYNTILNWWIKIRFQLGSLARTCNVATDRLVYQDVRGLSTTEPYWHTKGAGPGKPPQTCLSWGPNRPYLAPAV